MSPGRMARGAVTAFLTADPLTAGGHVSGARG
jgi:hypothetical protein